MISKCMPKAVFAAVLFLAPLAIHADEDTRLHIEPQPLNAALREFAERSGLQVMYAAEVGEGVNSPGTSEPDSNEEALDELLANTGLEFEYINERTVAIGMAEERGYSDPKNLSAQPVLTAQNASRAQASTETNDGQSSEDDKPRRQSVEEEDTRGQIETIVVVGSRNAGIRRYEDDVQPYVVYGESELASSFAVNIEEFLKMRLPMNATQVTNAQSGNNLFGNQSQIDLRGLGADQTLILVNGRRMPSVSRGTSFGQPDINGIPISAVERIEVLPATAAGIYGGGATGGAINIVLKRNYVGGELALGFDSTFRSDADRRRLDGVVGFNLEGGRTSIFLTGSYSDASELLVGDRKYEMARRNLVAANNPSSFLDAFTPIAGFTPNIRSTDRSDLVLDNGTPLNSPYTHVPIGYEGATTDGGAALVANAGAYNLDLSGDLSGSTAVLLNNPEIWSATVAARRKFTDALELTLDIARFSNKGRAFDGGFAVQSQLVIPDDAPTNPFTTDVRVTFPIPGFALPRVSLQESTFGYLGANIDLPDDWRLNVEYGLSRSRLDASFYTPALEIGFIDEITGGNVDVIRDTNAFPIDPSQYFFDAPTLEDGPYDTDLSNITIRTTGTFGRLPGGPIVVSSLLESRKEEKASAFRKTTNGTTGVETFTYFPSATQRVDSVYLEMLLPVLAARSSAINGYTLEFQVAGRHDRYKTRSLAFSQAPRLASKDEPLPDIEKQTTTFSSTDFTVGFKFQPIEDVALRASFGTGFLPASLSQLTPRILNIPLTLTDPLRGGVPSRTSNPVEWVLAGNPNLVPEESESHSVGILFSPRFINGLTVSVDYTEIAKKGEISSAFNFTTIFDFEDQFPERVVRAPLTPEDELAGYTGGEVLKLDLSSVNIARSRVEAVDFQVNYTRDTERMGRFDFYFLATRQSRLMSRISPTSSFVNRVAFSDGPLEWRGNVGLDWHAGPWSIGWNAQYFDSYKVYSSTASDFTREMAILNQGSESVPSQMYHDLYALYEFGGAASGLRSALAGLRIRVGIQNVFDEKPPIIASGRGYSAYGDPRLNRYSISLEKSF